MFGWLQDGPESVHAVLASWKVLVGEYNNFVSEKKTDTMRTEKYKKIEIRFTCYNLYLTQEMTSMNKEDIQTQLRSSLFLMVSKVVEEETKKLDVNATPMFIASLVELTMNQILNVGEDLELFANHAGRSTVSTDDFYMVVRKNEALAAILKEYESKLDA